MVRAAIVIAIVLAAAPATAQGAGADADAPGIELEVGAREARAIDVPALREALARELAMEVRMAGRGAPGAPRVRVRAIGRTRAVLELRRPDGSRMQRSTELDRDPAERLETIVILAVNMVRDEASELLDLLRRRRPATGGDHAATDATGTDAQAVGETTAASETLAGIEAVAATEPAGATEAAPPGAMIAATEADPAQGAVPASETAHEQGAIDAASERGITAPPATDAPAASAGASTPRLETAAPGELPRAPGPWVARIALGALVGSVPRGTGYEVTLLGGLEVAWTPTDFFALGVRDLGGGAPLSSIGRWSVGGAVFAELGWILDPALTLHLELGVDVRANGVGAGQDSVGVAPLAVIGARFFPIREFSIALQTGLHVVVTDAWSSNLHVLPAGAVMWTGGVSFAVHLS